MRRAGFVVSGLFFVGIFGLFAACGGDDSDNESTDGSTNGDAISGDGSSDGANATDGRLADGALVDGGSNSDAATFGDGACTPRGDGGPFGCGGGAAGTCTDSTTQYCIYGAVPNTCQPLPAACQCEETFTCDCLVANLICDDGGAEALCLPHADGGLAEARDAATSSFFWIDAHHCVPR